MKKRGFWFGFVLLTALLICGIASAATSPVVASIELDPSYLAAPGKVNVSITVSNTSNEDLKDPVTLLDPAAQVVADFGNSGQATLKAGQSLTWTGEYDVSQSALDNGSIIYYLKYTNYLASGEGVEQSIPIQAKITTQKADVLLQLVIAERAEAGVAPLSMGSSALNAAAQARAEELTVNYSYTRPNGSREFTILPEYGVDDVSVGENYWAAAEDASDVVAAWNRYDFFKERMLDKDATSVGIGYYEGGEYGNYWVMIFTYARGTSENGFAQEVLALVNAERAKENLAPLAMGDAKLQAAADERAKEVAKVASHTRPDGTNCFTVLKEYGVSDTATGENAAWGETTPEKVVADWMASEGHRVNIMDPAAKYMCLGYNYDANSQWGHNWIQIFAK